MWTARKSGVARKRRRKSALCKRRRMSPSQSLREGFVLSTPAGRCGSPLLRCVSKPAGGLCSSDRRARRHRASGPTRLKAYGRALFFRLQLPAPDLLEAERSQSLRKGFVLSTWPPRRTRGSARSGRNACGRASFFRPPVLHRRDRGLLVSKPAEGLRSFDNVVGAKPSRNGCVSKPAEGLQSSDIKSLPISERHGLQPQSLREGFILSTTTGPGGS